jgi:hypothetical protein
MALFLQLLDPPFLRGVPWYKAPGKRQDPQQVSKRYFGIECFSKKALLGKFEMGILNSSLFFGFYTSRNLSYSWICALLYLVDSKKMFYQRTVHLTEEIHQVVCPECSN